MPDRGAAKPGDEAPPATASLVLLGCNVVAYAAIVFVTLGSRRVYARIVDPADLRAMPPAAEIFLTTPGAIYAAVFLLLVVGLLVKEFAIERKDVTLWLNMLFLVLAFALGAVYWLSVRLPIMRLQDRMGSP